MGKNFQRNAEGSLIRNDPTCQESPSDSTTSSARPNQRYPAFRIGGRYTAA